MGRGVQNKLLEALAMGLPCVASTAAWRGTVVPAAEGILATDNAREFARNVIDLLGDSNRRTETAGRARAAAEANYCWDVQLSRLDQVIATAVSHPRRRTEPAPAE